MARQPVLNPDPETFFKQARKAATAVILPNPKGLDFDRPYALGIARENVPGYTPSPAWRGGHGYKTYDEAVKAADEVNREVFHLDPKEAYLIVASSLAGGVKAIAPPEEE